MATIRTVAALLTAAVLATAVAPAGPAVAQDDDGSSELRVGSDVFRAGTSAVFDTGEANDVFLAGERVAVGAATGGSAHLAGRRIEVTAPVGRDLYAAGMDVQVAAPVTGSATLFGYDVQVLGEVGGGLRASGATVRVGAPVGGAAVLAARELTIDAPLAGDAAIGAEDLTFGPDVTIAGRLILFGDAEQLAAIPERVIPPERIELRDIDEMERADLRSPSAVIGVGGLVGGFLLGVLVLAALATLAASIAPVGVETLRDEVSARPLRTFGIGFLTLSVLIGSAVVVAFTLIGLFVAPAILFVAVLIGFVAWVLGIYMLGAWIWERTGNGEPASLGQRALAGLIGAAVASVVLVVPILGWLFMLVVVLTGIGALATAWPRPRFFA